MTTKRYRKRKTKPGRLEAYYGKDDSGDIDVVLAYGAGLSKRHGALLYYLLCCKRHTPNGEQEPSMLDQLQARGFDIKTLRFSVDLDAAREPSDGR